MSNATGDLLSYFDAKEVEGTPPVTSWKVAPTQSVPIACNEMAADAPPLKPKQRGIVRAAFATVLNQKSRKE